MSSIFISKTIRTRIPQSYIIACGLISLVVIVYYLFAAAKHGYSYGAASETSTHSLNANSNLGMSKYPPINSHTNDASGTSNSNHRIFNDSLITSHVNISAASNRHHYSYNDTIKKKLVFIHSKSNVCSNAGQGIELLIMVISAPGNGNERMAIRNTWGHFGMRIDVAVRFVIGSMNNVTLEKSVNAELSLYDDIVWCQFLDTYNNLTLKTICTLEWMLNCCPQAQFLLKIDDDMFLNVPLLLNFTHGHHADSDTIFGKIGSWFTPDITSGSKWAVSWDELPFSQLRMGIFYPDFAHGPAYLITSDAVSKLYHTALTMSPFKLEDVFLTAFVAEQVGTARIHVPQFVRFREEYSNIFDPCFLRETISVHAIAANEQYELWSNLFHATAECSKDNNATKVII